MANKIFEFLYWRIVKPINNWHGRQRWNIPAIVKKNTELQGQGKGKVAFLLATGPSIKEQNLKLLAGQDCYSLSNFFLHEDLAIINPKYHFFAPYHKPLVLENYIEWLKLADQKLPSETAIFLGWQDQKMIQSAKLFQNREVRYLNFVPIKKPIINIAHSTFAPQSGPLMILPVLLYMGYETIYLVGCDHNVLRDYKKHIRHFYPQDNDLRLNASNGWESSILKTMKSEYFMFEQYNQYFELARTAGIKIINLSKDSWLDIIPIQNFDTTVSSNKKTNFS